MKRTTVIAVGVFLALGLLGGLLELAGVDLDDTEEQVEPGNPGAGSQPEPRDRPSAANETLAAFRDAGLPVREARDTSSQCHSVYPSCRARITTEDVSIIVFGNDEARESYEAATDAKSVGQVTLSYVAARTPERNQQRYERVLERRADP